MLYTKKLLQLVNVPANIFDDAYSYMLIIFFGLFSIVFYNYISSLLRALGDSKTPLFFLIFACITNIVLDFVFILCFDWGVSGVAWATVISQLSAGFWCLLYALKKFPIIHIHKSDCKFDFKLYYEQLKLSLPMALQISIIAFGVIILQAEVNKLGEVYVGAMTIGAKIEQLALQLLFSMGIALGTYSAMNYGAKKYNRIRVGVTILTVISIIACIILGICLIIFAPQLTALFLGKEQLVKSPEILENVLTYLKSTVPFYIPLQLFFMYRCVLQGMGIALYPFIAGIIELLVRGLFSGFVGEHFGYHGLCFVSPMAWTAASVLIIIVYFKKIKEKTKKYL